MKNANCFHGVCQRGNAFSTTDALVPSRRRQHQLIFIPPQRHQSEIRRHLFPSRSAGDEDSDDAGSSIDADKKPDKEEELKDNDNIQNESFAFLPTKEEVLGDILDVINKIKLEDSNTSNATTALEEPIIRDMLQQEMSMLNNGTQSFVEEVSLPTFCKEEALGDILDIVNSATKNKIRLQATNRTKVTEAVRAAEEVAEPMAKEMLQQEKEKSKKKMPVTVSCRIVTSSCGKLPSQRSLLPSSLYEPPYVLDKLDAIYHAMAHYQTRSLKFMEDSKAATTSTSDSSSIQRQPATPKQREQIQHQHALANDDNDNYKVNKDKKEEEEEKVVRILRTSLEDAGFELMTRRDLDLCQALNSDYLLRLSIAEDLSALDENISRQFYPERFSPKQQDAESNFLLDKISDEIFKNDNNNNIKKNDIPDDFLYDGRVLVFWRGYGQELTQGRLLLPKIDYLQASIVQRVAFFVRVRLNFLEEKLSTRLKSIYDRVETSALYAVAYALEMIPSRRVSEWARATLEETAERTKQREQDMKKKDEKLFTLKRYGGYRKSFTSSQNPTDALTPFMICAVGYGDESGKGVAYKTANGNATMDGSSSDVMDPGTASHEIYEALNRGHLTCEYDEEMKATMEKDPGLPPMQLLERTSVSNLVDFKPSGTRNLIKTIIGKSELNEPTYQEVCFRKKIV